ncbi:MAG: phosphoadenosine phosphosulfate reductase family protein [Clostridia bacterium]|nr:phosphoadenosine phosphosulfate reductase family protein [Clostridia bacterium]
MCKQLSIFETDNSVSRTYEPLPKNIYGTRFKIYPHVPSKDITKYDRKKYIKYLNPLESYDYILLAYSGGKDSLAVALYLIELGVPKEKIILLHHAIDGKDDSPILKMDWPVTLSYCDASAKALGLTIKYSWREGGFAKELFRLGVSQPICFEELENKKLTVTYSKNYIKCKKLKDKITALIESDREEEAEEKMRELKTLGYRYKFPAKSPSLATRWCSSALKIEVCDRLLRYCEKTSKNSKVLLVDGIRREESSNRNRYNEMELHTCNAPSERVNRIVHHWRPIIDWSEAMVWNIIKKHRLKAHPCYYLGWGRCSCAGCIFSQPKHYKGLEQVLPETFNALVKIEKEINFTIDNNKDLMSYIENSESCLPKNPDMNLIKYINTGLLSDDYVSLNSSEAWELPCGAFHGADGGPC